MLAALAHRGRDGQNTWSSGPIAMGHQAFWTTPEAQGEVQPWRHPSREVVATLDGRIDNRRALRDALVARGLAPAPSTTPSWSFAPMNAGARISRASSWGISR